MRYKNTDAIPIKEEPQTIYEKPTRKSREKVVEMIHGECLEGMGLIIPHGGIAVVDRTATPKLGDLVICRKHRDYNDTYCKQVKELGDVVTVGTCYLDKTRDFTFKAEVITGVVIYVFDKLFHGMIYERSNEDAIFDRLDKDTGR